MLQLLAPWLLISVLGAGQIESEVVTFTSTYDQTVQPARLYASPQSGPQPLLILLHTWSSDMDTYDPDDWVAEARTRGWHVVLPNYRGANKNPEACASPASRQDVLDCVPAVKDHVTVDPSRVYLTGVSGGAHMAMIMAAYHPEAFTAISAWVGISDLAAWHAETKAAGRNYWQDVEACVGGAPGSSAAVDAEIVARSPLHHLANAVTVPLDLNAGIHDGHTGSVPIHHTLDAFNVVAAAAGTPVIPQSQINALSQEVVPPNATHPDSDYGRAIHFRASSRLARVTIFEGGHDWLPTAACAWLGKHRRG
jgi:poly(3-hydroxybutyrate) depolymerase